MTIKGTEVAPKPLQEIHLDPASLHTLDKDARYIIVLSSDLTICPAQMEGFAKYLRDQIGIKAVVVGGGSIQVYELKEESDATQHA